MNQLEVIPYTIRGRYEDDGKTPKVFHCPDWRRIPDQEPKLVTCKRRACPRCGPRWAKDWHRLNSLNLQAYGGAVVMVTITAPGEERLPWDEAHCAHRRKHVHRGPSGCRVQQRQAREWSDTLAWRWEKLRSNARLATRRDLADPFSGELGPGPTILERAYEPQKRGVPHLHVVLGYRTEAEKDAAHIFVGHVKRLVGQYDFGFADGKGKKRGVRSTRPLVERFGVELRPMSGNDAANYLANYLTGRNSKKGKSTIRENISDPIMPRSLLWLSPVLTRVFDEQISAEELEQRIAEALADGGEEELKLARQLRSRLWIQQLRERIGIGSGTGITMRFLRRARHLWAHIEGRVTTPPAWADTEDALRTIIAYLQAYGRRPPPEQVDAAVQCARECDARIKRAHRWRRYLDSGEMTSFAASLAAKCFPTVEEVATA